MRSLALALLILGCGDDTVVGMPDARRPDAPGDGAGGDARPDGAGADAQPDAEACPSDFHTATPGKIHCGPSCCTVPGAPTFCCFSFDAVCLGSCQPGSEFYACDGPDDCGGSLCCAVMVDIGSHSSCRAGATQCMAGEKQLCHSAADCPAAAHHCCLWRTLTSQGMPAITLGACFADPAGLQMCD